MRALERYHPALPLSIRCPLEANRAGAATRSHGNHALSPLAWHPSRQAISRLREAFGGQSENAVCGFKTVYDLIQGPARDFILKKSQLLTMKQKRTFYPGQIVHVRWMGVQEFEIVKKSDQTQTKFPHWICRTVGSFGVTDELWLFSQLLLSTVPLKQHTGDGNRKQLSIFGNQNLVRSAA